MRCIHTADWHLRLDLPRCRRDPDWLNTQRLIIREIVALSNHHKCPVALVGDLFHTPRVPDEVVSMLIEESLLSKYGIGVISGNHDLPYHSWDNVSRSSFGIVWNLAENEQAGLFPLFKIGVAGQWGQSGIVGSENEVLFLHRLVFKSQKDLPPNVEASLAQDLLDEFPDFDWILTGDMHKAFHYEKDGRHVVNPGCITRQAADFKDYRPSVYLVDTEEGIVEQLFLNETAEVIDDAYLRAEEERDERITAFVDTVKTSGTVSLDFKANIETALLKTKLKPATKSMVVKLLEDANARSQ